MKPVWLIAGNFLREQRWPVVILLGWVVLLSVAAGFSDLRRTPEDVFMLFQQVAVYILVFSLFFGASAIRNELRTRRILAVLSKGISRRQYIAGLLLGIVMAIAIYCLALGMAGAWVLPQVGVPAMRFGLLLLGLGVASLLTACLALFFSIFLHPLLATGATLVIVGSPLLVEVVWNSSWAVLVPVRHPAGLPQSFPGRHRIPGMVDPAGPGRNRTCVAGLGLAVFLERCRVGGGVTARQNGKSLHHACDKTVLSRV